MNVHFLMMDSHRRALFFHGCQWCWSHCSQCRPIQGEDMSMLLNQSQIPSFWHTSFDYNSSKEPIDFLRNDNVKLKGRYSGSVLSVNLGRSCKLTLDNQLRGTACFTWRRLSFGRGWELAAFLWVRANASTKSWTQLMTFLQIKGPWSTLSLTIIIVVIVELVDIMLFDPSCIFCNIFLHFFM